jgi:hypothetical protein
MRAERASSQASVAIESEHQELLLTEKECWPQQLFSERGENSIRFIL